MSKGKLRQITTSVKSFIKDSKGFVQNIKNENLSDDEELVSFDFKDITEKWCTIKKEEQNKR